MFYYTYWDINKGEGNFYPSPEFQEIEENNGKIIQDGNEIKNILLNYVPNEDFLNLLSSRFARTGGFKSIFSYDNQEGKVVIDIPLLEKFIETDNGYVDELKKHYQNYLNETSWYAQRKMEFNVDIPEEISTKRLEAFNYLNNH